MQYDGGELAIQIVTSTVEGVYELARMTLQIKSVCVEDQLSHLHDLTMSFSIYNNNEDLSWNYYFTFSNTNC